MAQHLFENHSKLEIIGPNHLRIETVKTQPYDPGHSRCGGQLLHSNIPGILKQTHKGVPNSHGYDHRGISYNRLGQPEFGSYPQNFYSCSPKVIKGTHGVTYGIPGNDLKIIRWTSRYVRAHQTKFRNRRKMFIKKPAESAFNINKAPCPAIRLHKLQTTKLSMIL